MINSKDTFINYSSDDISRYTISENLPTYQASNHKLSINPLGYAWEARAVFLDYDNTLGKTETVALSESFEVINQALATKGVTNHLITKQDFVANYAGKTFRETLLEFSNRLGVSFSQQELDLWVASEKFAVVAQLGMSCEPCPGSLSALEYLSNNFSSDKIAVVSSSAPDRIQACLNAAGQAQFGLSIFSCQASSFTGSAKPAPDIYLASAEAAGIKPEDALAVEDSASGIAAALAAGMKVVVTCGAAENLNHGWFDKLKAQVDVKLQQLSERYQINDYKQLADTNIVAVIYDLNDLSTVLEALAINGDIS